MKVFHLSHTDLDGYAAQFVTSKYFDDITFFNSNYGKEINVRMDQIVSSLNGEKSLVLITDLNLTTLQCEEFQEKIKDKNAKILLLDHHISGMECVKKYPWYFLDSSRCATAITFDFFSEIFGDEKGLKKLRDVVNSVDIWLKDEDEFEVGKVLLSTVANAKEINKVMFDKEHREHIFYILERSLEFFDKKDSHIALDEAMYFIKKDFFIVDKNDTFGNLISSFVVKHLSKQKENITIRYGDKIGVLTYNIGNTSVIGNDFLVQNDEYDFFMDITSRKSISLRSNDKMDVSLMASKLFNGGGHVNASGGVFLSFKDSYVYDDIKSQVQSHINAKLNETKEQDDAKK